MRTTVGTKVKTRDGIGYVIGRSKRKGVLWLLVKMPNGANYPYRADQVTRP